MPEHRSFEQKLPEKEEGISIDIDKLELELIQTQMAQKPMPRAEVYAGKSKS